MTKENRMKSDWHMTDAELKTLWRNAEDKHKQIKVIAELNCKSKKETVDKLRMIGIELPDDLVKKSMRFSPEDDRRIWIGRQNNEPYNRLAAALGNVSDSHVASRYHVLLCEHRDAVPTIEKALRAYLESKDCTQQERETLLKQIRRGI